MDATHPPSERSDRGFTLVEITVVIAILGIIAAVVAFSVRGVNDRGEESSCASDARVVTQAAEVYLVQHGVAAIPATGAGADRFEVTLVDAGFLREVSTYHDLQADGTVVSTGAPCP